MRNVEEGFGIVISGPRKPRELMRTPPKFPPGIGIRSPDFESIMYVCSMPRKLPNFILCRIRTTISAAPKMTIVVSRLTPRRSRPRWPRESPRKFVSVIDLDCRAARGDILRICHVMVIALHLQASDGRSRDCLDKPLSKLNI